MILIPHKLTALFRCRAVGDVPTGNLYIDFFLFVKALTYTKKKKSGFCDNDCTFFIFVTCKHLRFLIVNKFISIMSALLLSPLICTEGILGIETGSLNVINVFQAPDTAVHVWAHGRYLQHLNSCSSPGRRWSPQETSLLILAQGEMELRWKGLLEHPQTQQLAGGSFTLSCCCLPFSRKLSSTCVCPASSLLRGGKTQRNNSTVSDENLLWRQVGAS